MARIAVAGFHHETNCFVEVKRDFAYFTAHRDRPPLVRGAEVIAWLGDTSFALSGFLKTIESTSRAMVCARPVRQNATLVDDAARGEQLPAGQKRPNG